MGGAELGTCALDTVMQCYGNVILLMMKSNIIQPIIAYVFSHFKLYIFLISWQISLLSFLK